MQDESEESEEDVITHLMYDGEVWKARYAIDKREYPVEFDSLDQEFLKPSIAKCGRTHRRLVAIPKGRAAKKQSTEIQLSWALSSEVGSMPGDL